MDDKEMLPNIRAHSLMVARVTHILFLELAKSPQKDIPLPPENLLLAGAILHDIAKTPCLDSGCHHAKKGRDPSLAYTGSENRLESTPAPCI